MTNKQIICGTFEMWEAIFCFVCSIWLFIFRNVKTKDTPAVFRIMLTNGILCTIDSLAWLFRGNEGKVGFIVVRAANYLVFVLSFIMQFFFFDYLAKHTRGNKNGVFKKINAVLCIISVLIITASQKYNFLYDFDEHNRYYRKEWYFLILLPAVFVCVSNICYLFFNRKSLKRKTLILFGFFILTLLWTIGIQFLAYGYPVLNISFSFIAIMIFLYQVSEREKIDAVRRKKYYEQKNRLLDVEKKLRLSQLKPHFIFNVLNSIYILCDYDKEYAKKTISEFSDYLRGNISLLSSEKMIPFNIELDYVKHYMELQQVCHMDELNVEYDIKYSNFMIPAFALQSIAENAVNHGTSKKEGVGTVFISAELENDRVVIKVKDDGPGYDKKEAEEKGPEHIGLSNTEFRIRSISGGTLDIEGKKDIGTEVTITLPVL